MKPIGIDVGGHVDVEPLDERRPRQQRPLDGGREVGPLELDVLLLAVGENVTEQQVHVQHRALLGPAYASSAGRVCWRHAAGPRDDSVAHRRRVGVSSVRWTMGP
jgi:hypothetical protein